MKKILQRSPYNIITLSSLRPPVTPAYKGGLKDAHPEEFLTNVLKTTITANANLHPTVYKMSLLGMSCKHWVYLKRIRLKTMYFNNGLLRSKQTLLLRTYCHNINPFSNSRMYRYRHRCRDGNYDLQQLTELKHSSRKDASDYNLPVRTTPRNVASHRSVSR